MLRLGVPNRTGTPSRPASLRASAAPIKRSFHGVSPPFTRRRAGDLRVARRAADVQDCPTAIPTRMPW